MALWTPADLASTPELWLKADALSLSNNDPVASWTESSGNGRNAAQSDSAKRPLFKTAVQNSLPAILFDGSDDILEVPDNAVWVFGDVTMFIVLKPTALSASWWLKSWFAQDAGSGNSPKWIWSATSGGQIFHLNNTDGTGPALAGGAGSQPSTSVFSQLALRKSSTTYAFYRDGTAYSAPTSSYTVPNSTAPVGVGRAETSSYDGHIAEILWCSSALSVGDREKVEGYLAWKWGIQASLPGGHTYAGAAPTTGGGFQSAWAVNATGVAA